MCSVNVCVSVCVHMRVLVWSVTLLYPTSFCRKNNVILSLHGARHSKERCLQGLCLKSTQTHSDTLDDKHMATVPSSQHTAFMDHELLGGVGHYCPLLAKGGTAEIAAETGHVG